VDARDTLIVHLDWSNVETATLEIDHGSDGTIDETLELEDQVEAGLPPPYPAQLLRGIHGPGWVSSCPGAPTNDGKLRLA